GLAAILERRAASMLAAPEPDATRALWGKMDEAATLEQRVLDIQRKTKGPTAPETLTAMNNRAISLMAMGKVEEAEPLLREVVQANVKNEPDDPGTLVVMSNYTSLLSTLSRSDSAADWAMRSMEVHLRVLKLRHPSTQSAVATAIQLKSLGQEFGQALAIAD